MKEPISRFAPDFALAWDRKQAFSPLAYSQN